ncbi:MAG TPA: cupin domain-containing protein [Gaiellaceae bacterium]|jgi:quercetin dioxygenase-like cupin family protein
MRYAIHPRDASPATEGGADVQSLFGAERGCDAFEQRVLRFADGAAAPRRDDARDELLYVLEGSGRLRVDGDDRPLAAGTAVFVASGTTWSVEAEGGLTALSVLVPDPVGAGTTHAVVDLAAGSEHGATAGRAFLLGACPDVGCASATQFVGLIPPGRAPDHFHTYDEVIYVLEGEGRLEIDGEQEPVGPGSCIHLPARTVHCLANPGAGELRVLGVFRPAGSPAEAYYPDGTPAAVPDE